MEIDIQTKTDNPLLKRTEIHFVIHHEGEKTPKREFVRTELADKLNAKKENILISYMKSSFGSRDTVGFAKVYKSLKDAKSGEKNHILKRNNIGGSDKKPAAKKEEKSEEEVDTKVEEKPETTEQPSDEKPADDSADKNLDKSDENVNPTDDKNKQDNVEEKKDEEKSAG